MCPLQKQNISKSNCEICHLNGRAAKVKYNISNKYTWNKPQKLNPNKKFNIWFNKPLPYIIEWKMHLFIHVSHGVKIELGIHFVFIL